MTKKMWFRAKDEIIILLSGCLLAFLFGMFICFLAVRIIQGDDITSASVASFLSIFFGAVLVSIVGGFTMINDFNLAIGMGYTRKKFLAEEMLATFIEFVIYIVVSVVLYKVDFFVLTHAYSDVPIDEELDMRLVVPIMLKPLNLVIFFAILLTVRFVFGLLIQVLGKKGWGIFYIVFMTLCIGGPRMAHLEAMSGVSERISAFGAMCSGYLFGMFWQCLIVAVCAVVFAVCYQKYKKLAVKAF